MNGAAIKLVVADLEIPFGWIADEEERDEAQYRAFLRRVLPALIAVARADVKLLEGRASINDICAIIKRADDGLQLVWSAATPAQQQRLAQSLASWWPKYLELRAKTKAVAEDLIARRANA